MVVASLEELVSRVHAEVPGNDPLGRVEAAVAVASGLSDQADLLVDQVVGEARRAGVSWTEIGARLGVSKQAARQRFLDRPSPLVPVFDPQVGLQPRLQACLTAAGTAASRAGATEVGTEHLLTGLLAEGVAAAILERLGVTADAIGESATRLFPRLKSAGDTGAAVGSPPWSAEAVCAIEGAAHIARRRVTDPVRVEVGTEHLLVCLAFDPGSRARRVLVDLGVDVAVIKKEMACHIPSHPRRPPIPTAQQQTNHGDVLVLWDRRERQAAIGTRARGHDLCHLRGQGGPEPRPASQYLNDAPGCPVEAVGAGIR